jgi:thiamine biosynthesis protein ThiS
MNLIVNGEERSVPDGLTVVQLLERLDLPGTRVAVERNRTIVPRTEFSQVHLEDGDRLEVVHFVGGG